MSREWKPGDVLFVPGVGRALVDGKGRWHTQLRGSVYRPEDASAFAEARPLVVIDPEDCKQVERLTALYERDEEVGDALDYMQEALRSLIGPPKPDEPTGLGAVVLGSDGNLWVAGPGAPGGKRWEPEDGGESRYYRDVPAISEMSVGVEPMAEWERDLLREVER